MSDTLFDLVNPEPAPTYARDFGKAPRARRSDPATSQQAAASLTAGRQQEVRARVLAIFRVLGPMTQHELIRQYHAKWGPETPESSIRTRCKELVDDREVRNTQRCERLPSGRPAIVWGLTNQAEEE